VCQRKQEYDRSVRIREFHPHWLKMFEWLEYHVTNGVGKMYCKICRKYERIGTFITGCRTCKNESIRSHNMSNGHTKNTLNYEATQCKPGESRAEKALFSMNKAAVSQLGTLFRNALAKTITATITE